MDLFAGIAVSDFASSVEWYQRLFGAAPSFFPNEREAVWELGERRYVFIELRPEHAGHARHLLFVDDLDALVAEIAGRGINAAERQTLTNGVRKVVYRDRDGNQLELGGGPSGMNVAEEGALGL